MNLQLISTRVDKLELLETSNFTEEPDGFGFKFANAYSEECSDTFQVIFEMELQISEGHQLSLKYTATFQLSETITDKFMESPFPRVNAPAIAYPFLRSFIGTFLLNAGYDPIMLPSVNFAAIDKQNANN